MSDPLLLYADTERSADVFHAIPEPIVDPFLYLEDDGRRVAVIGVLDADKVRAAGVEVVDPYALGLDELLAQGVDEVGLWTELSLRASRQRALERLRAAGIRTQLTKAPGEVLEDGAPFSLGHGVGLEVQEAPGVGGIDATLVAGHVIALERASSARASDAARSRTSCSSRRRAARCSGRFRSD